ncbi:SDR family NAD(P)-dependent oxidoreductase [Paenibacillus sp. MMS18-CY102]|uniref:SDR family NAD(P)-dependent oxidoreductase n=1 Tax=Paenibacillus sp. MMS18-CY102 TaxID=2682849 RepID=UPI001365CAE7|nr:SDR family oxidoreductase [Paenibacillus sp. MMS18-CY102]MWC28957.1 SDR family NAD(P)-dependent oxidoreductase [Paenibacillus sp. MMS18-CY102]
MINGKKIVITGASSGLGLLAAVKLIEQGATVALTGRNLSKLQQAASQLPGGQKRYKLYALDVTDSNQTASVLAQVWEDLGGVDVLVNNAGFGLFERLVDAPLEHFEQMMDTNYMGAVRCTKAVLPLMLQRGNGQIVNIASIAGKIGTPKSTGYTASKHAMLGFTNALRQELQGTGIVVSAVNPGPFDTPFFQIADPDGSYVSNVKGFMMKPERVADAVVRVIGRQKAEIDLPGWASMGAKLYQLFPRLSDKVAGRWLNKK